MPSRWFVGGDDVLHRWHVVREATTGGSMALEYIQQGNNVKVFEDKVKAETTAKSLNRWIEDAQDSP